MVKSTGKTQQPTNTALLVEKPLAEAVSAAQDTPTQHVEREKRHGQARVPTQPTPKAFVGFRRPEPIEHYKPFAEALRAAMVRANVTASDLARVAWGTTKNRKGHNVARNRDRISHYLAATQYPEPVNLKKLADVLGVEVEEFAITRDNSVARSRPPGGGDLQISTIPGDPDVVRFQLDRIIPYELSIRFQQMLKEAERATEQLGEVIDTPANGTK